jgi:hypothetical protein
MQFPVVSVITVTGNSGGVYRSIEAGIKYKGRKGTVTDKTYEYVVDFLIKY